jgi:microcystin-dependent protein
MAKIPRVFQNLFGAAGTTANFGQFGSKAAGFPVTTQDAATIQALPAFTQNGWEQAVISGNKAPYLEDMNGITLLIFQQLCNLFQDGIPAWDPDTTYYTGSIVRQDGTNFMFSSAIDDNVGNPLPNQSSDAYWTYLNTEATPAGSMIDFAGSTAPTGWLMCDGSSYSATSYPALFAVIGYTWGGSGPNFNVPDMRGRTSIGAGTGSGLTPRTLGQTLGEETHVLVVGEMPSHNHSQNPHSHGPSAGSTNFVGSNASESTGTGLIVSGSPIYITQFDPTTGQTTATNNLTGGGAAHNNMQPSGVVTKIIKY